MTKILWWQGLSEEGEGAQQQVPTVCERVLNRKKKAAAWGGRKVKNDLQQGNAANLTQ